jgi:hypothetical protein
MSHERPNSGLEGLLSTPLNMKVIEKNTKQNIYKFQRKSSGIRCFLGDEFSLGPAARLVSPGVQNVRQALKKGHNN